mmetsp:Transcript_39235/g.124515  ORF Transcript_39235/g.124515 Transcript_39235/m.124515 type:complete len:216 (+) Transcript_39235:313-960(+)
MPPKTTRADTRSGNTSFEPEFNASCPCNRSSGTILCRVPPQTSNVRALALNADPSLQHSTDPHGHHAPEHDERCSVLLEVDRLALKMPTHLHCLRKPGDDLLVGALALQHVWRLAKDLIHLVAREHREAIVCVGDFALDVSQHHRVEAVLGQHFQNLSGDFSVAQHASQGQRHCLLFGSRQIACIDILAMLLLEPLGETRTRIVQVVSHHSLQLS